VRSKVRDGLRVEGWLDGVAVCASTACMIHCLALPLLMAALPTIAESLDPGESFHLLMLLVAIPTSALALGSGWRRSRAIFPLICGGCGLMIIAAGVATAPSEAAEAILTVSGSLLLAAAHILNWRGRGRQLRTCSAT